MNFRTVTLGALGSMFYLFFIKIFNTIFPTAFVTPDLAIWVQILSFLANFILLLFFIYFRIDYIRPFHKKLRVANVLLIISFTIITLVSLKKIFMIFPDWFSKTYSISPFLADLFYRESIHLSSLGFPLLNNLIMLFFLISFYNEALKPGNTLMIDATRYATMGTVLLLILNSVFFLARIFSNQQFITGLFSGITMFLLVLIFIMIYASYLYFFFTFYRTELAA